MRGIGRLSLAPFVVFVALAGCEPPARSLAAGSAAPPKVPPSAAPSATPTGTPVTPIAAGDVTALARATNAFALDFYAKLRARKGNLALSPFSISTALTMTWAGAKGDTAAQMKKVLHLGDDRALEIEGALLASYAAPDQSVTVRVANRLFGEKTYAFEQPYLDRVQAAFGAPLEALDFQRSAGASRDHINAWVARQTQDRITGLIPSAGIDSSTRLVLTNAVYFLGDWEVPFTKEATSPAPFFTSATDRRDVATMHQTTQLRFGATEGVKLVDVPYKGGSFAMTLVLPDAVDGLADLEARLTPETLDRWLGATVATRVAVSLPKLEIAPAEAISLGDTLAAMGMPLAFDADKADFTGIANPRNANDRLHVSRVFHKAFVKVDEKGTEAAAASAVVMAVRGLAPQPKAELKADHPFLFLIRDTRSGLILFMGRVADPASK